MGLSGLMKVIPAALFERHKDDLAELEVPDDAHEFHLDAWHELYSGLYAMPRPLRMTITGDHPVGTTLDDGLLRDASDDDDDDDENDGDCYFGYASPELVKQLDAALGHVDEAELMTEIKTSGFPSKVSEQKLYRKSFAELRKAYRKAADSGAAILIAIT